MDWKVILQIVEIVAFIVGGFVISYLRTSSVVRGFLAELIADAEEMFSTVEKSGAQKMAWVIAQLIEHLPAWLKPFLTAEKLQAIVQGVFDKINAYADIQVAKLDAKYDAWKNAKLLELEAEKKNSAALRAALEAKDKEHDEALSAEMIKRLNAEATVAQFQAAASQSAAKKTTKKA